MDNWFCWTDYVIFIGQSREVSFRIMLGFALDSLIGRLSSGNNFIVFVLSDLGYIRNLSFHFGFKYQMSAFRIDGFRNHNAANVTNPTIWNPNSPSLILETSAFCCIISLFSFSRTNGFPNWCLGPESILEAWLFLILLLHYQVRSLSHIAIELQIGITPPSFATDGVIWHVILDCGCELTDLWRISLNPVFFLTLKKLFLLPGM